MKVIPFIATLGLLSVSGCSKDDGPSKDAPSAERFSFFVTSLKAMQELSGNEDGFGGDLRFGETGPGAGLRGATCASPAAKAVASALAIASHSASSASQSATIARSGPFDGGLPSRAFASA